MKNLINCPDCGNPTSKDAVSCPKCGKSIKPTATNVLAGLILLIGAAIVIFAVIGTFNFSWDTPKTDLKGEVFISENGQKYPFETASVRIYLTDKIKEMSAEEIELTASEAITKTDADGKFSVKIPNGDYTAVADASRAVNKQIEHYHWKTRFTVSDEGAELILNNQNLSSK